MKKKLSVIFVIGILLFNSCTGGGGNSGTSGKPYKITMVAMTTSSLPELGLVQGEINKKLQAKGLELEILPLSYSALNEQINLMISGGEKLDLIPVLNTVFNSSVAQGKLLPITKYLETIGMPVINAVGTEYIKAGTVNGEIYAIPSLRDMAASFGVCFRKDILEKYGFKAGDVKNLNDVNRIYEKVSKGEPGMFMTYSQAYFTSMVADLLLDWDGLGNDYGVLMNYGQNTPLTVVNLFETPEYEQKVRFVRNWYQKGYVVPDASTNDQSAVRLIGAGQLFSFGSRLKPGFDRQSTLGAGGVEIVTAPLFPAFSTTTQAGVLSWAVPITCQNPGKVVEFLNLFYNDAELVNLFAWGIEGRHYVKLNDQVITYPPGVSAANSGYNMNLTWTFGNSLLAYVWEGNAPDTNDQMREFNRNAILSKALGFQFDATPVRSAITAVTNVAGEYRLGLEHGMVDPDIFLPRFRRALKDAGIDGIVAEKQRQLDAWLAGNGS